MLRSSPWVLIVPQLLHGQAQKAWFSGNHGLRGKGEGETRGSRSSEATLSAEPVEDMSDHTKKTFPLESAHSLGC